MSDLPVPLHVLLEGWNGYHQSIVNAVRPLTADQLGWRPANHFHSVGELARHMSLGRITWLQRMSAPGITELVQQIHSWETDPDGNRTIDETSFQITEDSSELVVWLERTWQVIDRMLHEWHVSDLAQTYPHQWNGKLYTPSRQWTIWRVMSHDIHHGGELSLMLGLQGIEALELSSLFGHVILPPLLGE
jgi:uncharacterized damage-inducible protein DinB